MLGGKTNVFLCIFHLAAILIIYSTGHLGIFNVCRVSFYSRCGRGAACLSFQSVKNTYKTPCLRTCNSTVCNGRSPRRVAYNSYDAVIFYYVIRYWIPATQYLGVHVGAACHRPIQVRWRESTQVNRWCVDVLMQRFGWKSKSRVTRDVAVN